MLLIPHGSGSWAAHGHEFSIVPLPTTPVSSSVPLLIEELAKHIVGPSKGMGLLVQAPQGPNGGAIPESD